jgi:hypothetical protein
MTAKFAKTMAVLTLPALFALSAAGARVTPVTGAPGASNSQAAASANDSAELSNDEKVAVAFMKTILYSERIYKNRHHQYTRDLSTLAGTGSVTRRMVKSRERAGYRVGFSSSGEAFSLTMTPLNPDAQHRAFYANQDGVIHVDQGTANAQSPVLKGK